MTITNIEWANEASGQFNVSGNWTPELTPSANTNAYIEATGSSYLVTSNATSVVNGLYVGSPAELEVSAGTLTINSFADDIAGEIQVDSGAIFNMGSAGASTFLFQNTGVLNIDGASSTNASFRVSSPTVVLRGGGKVTMTGSHDAIVAGAGASTLTNRDNTISGLGTIGSANLTLQNGKSGVIDADLGSALTLYTSANTILNDGLVESTSTGGLIIDSNMYQDSLLLADGAGAVTIAKDADVSGAGDVEAQISGASIVLDAGMLSMGGIISTVAGSMIRTVAGTTDTLSSSDIKNAGEILDSAGSTLLLNATVENTGSLNLVSSGTATILELYNNGVTFDGSGSIVLSNNAHNEIISNGTSQTFVNNGNTIKGAGSIGDAYLRLVNHLGGVINANSTVAMILTGDTPTSSLNSDYNDGTIEVTGTGGLTVTGVWSDAGVISAAASGATLQLDNFTGNSGGGLVETATSGATIILNDVNLSAVELSTVANSTVNIIDTSKDTTNSLTNGIDNAGQINLTNTTLTISGHLLNSGTVNLTGSTTADVVTLTGGLTRLQDGGQLILGNSAGNSVVSDGSAEQFRNIDNTISGFGTIGDSNVTVQNEYDGVINANSANNLAISTGTNQVINAGLLESTSSGGMTLSSALYDSGNLGSSAGDLYVEGAVTGLGNANISGTGEIEFGLGAALDTYFSSSAGTGGILRLDHSSTADDAYDGRIYGFAGNDKIDFSDIAYKVGVTQFAYSSGPNEGTLTISNGSTSSTIQFAGAYTQGSFALGTDNHGGTYLTL